MAQSSNNKTESSSTDFAKHAQQDKAIRQPDPSGDDNITTKAGGLSLSGRIMAFVVFPVTVGTFGLYIGYLESVRKPEKTFSFDQDFVMPCLLALAMACVLFFQTGGLSTNEVKPLVAWPKVRRVKKIIKKSKASKLEEEQADTTSNNKKDD